jgi:hypothetical protein
MKRIFRIIYHAFFILIMPFSIVTGQDTKSEQKIKIILNNGSGTKVVMDTILYSNTGPDSIKLKDGTVVYLRHSGKERDSKYHTGKDHIFITASSDGKEDGKRYKEVTVISSDSVRLRKEGNSDDVICCGNSNEGKCCRKYRIITRSSGDQGDKGETIQVNKGKSFDKEIDNTFDVYVSASDSESSVEKTRYVIAKDGLVVTIEGTDEAKTKELAKEIENKLGIKSEGTKNKEIIKAESKEQTRK